MSPLLPRLTSDEQHALLDLARRAVRARVLSRPAPRLEPPLPRLLQPQGAFVSLHQTGRLRGCIGMALPRGPLADTVADCAAAAAAEDPRFAPLEPHELETLAIEISALDEPFTIRAPGDIVLGEHGLIVTLGTRRGLLLPQVATDQGWDAARFLEETCRKAGVPPGSWERGAIVEAFSAQVFSDRTGLPY